MYMRIFRFPSFFIQVYSGFVYSGFQVFSLNHTKDMTVLKLKLQIKLLELSLQMMFMPRYFVFKIFMSERGIIFLSFFFF